MVENSRKVQVKAFTRETGKKNDKKQRVMRMRTGVKGYELMNGVKFESQ